MDGEAWCSRNKHKSAPNKAYEAKAGVRREKDAVCPGVDAGETLVGVLVRCLHGWGRE